MLFFGGAIKYNLTFINVGLVVHSLAEGCRESYRSV